MNKRNLLKTVTHCLEERTMLAAGDEDQSQQQPQNKRPPQNHQQPQQNHQQSQQNPKQPQQNPKQPQQNHKQPQQNHQQPQQNHQQPQQNPKQPQQNHKQPQQNHQQPQQNHQQPQQNHQQPQQNHQQPQQNHQQPQQNSTNRPPAATSAETTLGEFYSSSYKDPASAPKTIEFNKKAQSDLNALAYKGATEGVIGEARGTTFVKNGRVEVAEDGSAKESKLSADPSARRGSGFHTHDNGTAPSSTDFFGVLDSSPGSSKSEVVHSVDYKGDPQNNKNALGTTYLLAKTEATTKGVTRDDFLGIEKIVPIPGEPGFAEVETVKPGEFENLFDKLESKALSEGASGERAFKDSLFETNKAMAKKYNLAFYRSDPGSNILTKVV